MDNQPRTVTLNISGQVFKCFEDTLNRFPATKLAQLVGESAEPKPEFFFDRSSALFEHILDSYRTGSIHFPKDVCPSRFRDEIEFWGLSVTDVSLCCWKTFCKAEDFTDTMDVMGQHFVSTTNINQQHVPTFRQRIWLLVDKPLTSKMAFIWAVWMTIVISTSTLVTALESVHGLRRNATAGERIVIDLIRNVTNAHHLRRNNVYLVPQPELYYTDIGCFAFMTIELLLRIVTCPYKKELFKDALMWMESLACVSFWITTLMEINLDKWNENWMVWALIISKYLSILKLVRLFRLTKHLSAFRVISLTFQASKHEFIIFGILLALLTCLFGFTIYVAEYFTESKFDTVFRALYWAVITLTTVGYGELVPSSAAGQVIASLCALCGLLVLAMPAGIIVSNFHNYYAQHLYVKRYVVSHKGESLGSMRRKVP